jgi:multiple sugar transport system permease protein/putative aldouronate transport system permease protein
MTATVPTLRRVARSDRSLRPAWEEKPTVAGQAGKGITLLILVALFVIPTYAVVLTSISTQASINIAGGLVLWPHGVTFEAYHQIFTNQLIIHSLLVSGAVTAVGTALSMVVSVLCAYGLSRRDSFLHRTILVAFVVTMFFSGGIIPTFLVVSALHGYQNYWSLVLPSVVSVFNILVLRAFFMSTAQELIDAARVDGAGHWRTLRSVVVPTSKPVLAVITLFYAVGYWNSFFNALLYLRSDQWPLQVIIYTYTLQGAPMPGTGLTNTGQYAGHQQIAALSIQMAVVTLTLLPIILVYPFVHRHLVKGMLLGAVKG